jgi:hypothetical protein
VRLVFITSAPLDAWLRGRNLAQAALATAQLLGLTAVTFGLLPGARPVGLALPLLAFPFGLLVLLAVGNLVAARHPQRYHLSLARRDRPPSAAFAAVLAGLAFVSLATLGALQLAAATGLPAVAFLALLPLLGALVYYLLLPLSTRWTAAHRESIITAIARS